MRKLLIYVILLGIGIVIISLLSGPIAFFQNITTTLEIWLYKVYPSVFTFYILASLLINSKIINKLIYLLSPIFKHLKFQNEKALHLFILIVFIGNPSSASLICEALERNEITNQDANNLLKCSSFLNRIFIISFMLSFSNKYVAIVIFVHIVSNIIIVLWINRKNKATEIHNCNVKFFLDAFFKSINNVIYLLLMISAIMVLCNIFKYSITSCLNYFKINNNIFEVLLANIEVTLGLNSILKIGFTPLLTFVLICFVSSFGGFSIHMQVVNVIGKYHLSYKSFFTHRLIQATIASLLFILFYFL
jgi:hypothetical protein